MLRPATPLTILLLISFVLLLLSVISTPVVKGIPIATFQGYNFGVFGYCKGSDCSGIRVGYTTDGLFGSSNNDGNFNLPSSARHSLSSILIVHPVAAFLNLVCLALAIAAHFHSPSHSARYLLALLILLLPTLLVTLLAFLVDILLFVPHLQWGGWIVLAATILITASGVVTCAMRRTLVARKARKRRIAENAEMSGENFYARQAEEIKTPMPPPLTAEKQAPLVNSSPGAGNMPSFAAFDASRIRQSEEQRRPFANEFTSGSATPVVSRDDGSDRYYGVPAPRSQSQPPNSIPRDEFGNPVQRGYGTGPSSVIRNRSEERRPGPYRDDSYGTQRGGFGPPRGRGGYPSRGSYGPRGGYAGTSPRGPPPPGFNERGGYPPGPPRGYSDRGRGGFNGAAMAAGAGAGMAAGAMMNRGTRQPPPGYPPQNQPMLAGGYPRPDEPPSPVSRPTSDVYNQQDDVPYRQPSPHGYEVASGDQFMAYGARAQSPARSQRHSPYGSRRQSPAGGFRQPSPPPPVPNMPPVGQAIEMDAAHGQMSPRLGSPPNQLRDSDADVRGMVGLQQNRQEPEAGGMYGQDQYVPPRQNWAPGHHAVTVTSNASPQVHTGLPRSPQPHQTSPVELSAQRSMVGGPSYAAPNRHRVNSGSSDVYYEDVPARFAPPPEPMPIDHDQRAASLAGSHLQPMPHQQRQFGPSDREEALRPLSDNLDPASSYENLQEGARSPAESETSNFTSVSQRGVNPNWRPGVDGPGAFGQYGPPGPGGNAYAGPVGPGPAGRKPVGPGTRELQMRRDVLLAGNPDFEIPGMRPPGRGRGGGFGGPGRGGGGGGGGRMGGGGPGGMGMSTISGDGGGRYPTS